MSLSNRLLNFIADDMEVTQEPDFDLGELSSTGRQLEVALGGAVQLSCPTGKHFITAFALPTRCCN